MDEQELIKIAVFKIGEAARRMDTLANSAQTPQGRRLLTAVARLLTAQEQDLRAGLARASSDATASGAKDTDHNHADKRIAKPPLLIKPTQQGRRSVSSADAVVSR